MISRTVSVDEMQLVLDKKLAVDLKCGICFGLLKQPCQCRNGHLFCGPCLKRLMDTSHNSCCPECRASISSETVARALFVEKAIRGLTLHCRYRFFLEPGPSGEWKEDLEDGCGEVVTLDNRAAHEAQCPHRFVPCPNGCDAAVRFSLRESHGGVCPRRPVRCRHCERELRACDVSSHEEHECPEYPVSCAECGEEGVARRQMEMHRQQCPDVAIACPFREQGCGKTVRRCDMEHHLREEAFQHMQMMRGMMEQQHALSTQRFKHAQLRIAALEAQLAQARATARMTNTLQWTIPDWEEAAKSKPFIRSKSFSVQQGFDFFFGVWPRGEGSPPPDVVGVYLFLERNDQTSARITVDFSVSLVNLLYEPMTVSFSCDQICFPLLDGEGWGEGILKTRFITPDSGFLSKDGSLTFHCTFRVVNLSFVL